MEFLLAFLIFTLLILLMSIGVLLGRKPIQGSCGGLSSVGIEKACDCKEVCQEHQRLYQIQEPD